MGIALQFAMVLTQVFTEKSNFQILANASSDALSNIPDALAMSRLETDFACAQTFNKIENEHLKESHPRVFRVLKILG